MVLVSELYNTKEIFKKKMYFMGGIKGLAKLWNSPIIVSFSKQQYFQYRATAPP